MDYRTLLNNKQFEAVSTDAKYARIVAGAGSGKTRVLTYRISYLISERDVKPSSIVAIAFTNKVAAEMKERALALVERKGLGVRVSTFHSFCAKFLRKEIGVLNFPTNFTIFDDEDQDTLIKNIAVNHGYKKNDDIVKSTMSFISHNKCVGKYPEDINMPHFASDEAKEILQMFEEYEEEKSRMYALDFDDLLLRTVQILRDFPNIRHKTQDGISNLLIDEFQDTNDVQYELVKLLMSPEASLFVVGDPDQTIYTWRGANQNIILNFERDFRGAKSIILNQNYRSTKTILDTANKLISNNKKRVPKDLFTENNDGESITVKAFRSRDEEAKFVIDEIERIRRSNPLLSYRDFAILYRAAYLTLPFETQLMRRAIPYEIYGGVKFFQRKEVKDVLAYFRLIYNTKDDISFERICNVPRRGLGKDALAKLKMEKEMRGLSYLEIIKELDKDDCGLRTTLRLSLKFLNDSIEKARARLEENLEAYPQILEDFITEIGYYNYLKSNDDGDERLENVKTLFDNILDFLRKNPESNFEEYLENAALQSSQDEIKDVDSVLLMTVHVAKGLEFPYVFVVSLNNGVFPSHRTVEESEDGIEEERRLCYVAFTRAKKKLFVTCNTGYSFVLGEETSESQFMKEAGLETRKGYQGNTYISNLNNRRYFSDYPARSSFFGDKTVNKSGYYSDEPSHDVFEEEKPKEVETNGITNWQVGDKVHHQKFGEGIVIKVISDTMIRVNFDEVGEKTMLSNHKLLTRIDA